MAQGMFGGMTSYDDQSLKEIKSDVDYWYGYTQEMMIDFESGIKKLKESLFWNKIGYDFRSTLISTVATQQAFLDDFDIIKKSIDTDSITMREVTLMNKIGRNSINYNTEYGRNYRSDDRWHDYDSEDFRIAESLYQRGRDYFVTLQDASNAARRFENYINHSTNVVNNVQQTISGDGNVITGVNTGTINVTLGNSIVEECNEAIEQIESRDEIDDDIKKCIVELLENVKTASEDDNKEELEKCKMDYIGFVKSAGSKAYKVAGVLATFATLAPLLGIAF